VRYRPRKWQIAIALVVFGAVLLAALYVWRMRQEATPAEMAAFLPTGDSLLLYMDLGAMRRSGLLDALAGPRGAEEAEYRRFIEQTGFNYRDDLDALAVAIRENPATHERDVYAVARGSFDWTRISAYAASHGGQCSAGFCRASASQPHRFISFYRIRSRLLALAVSSDQWAALLISRGPGPRGASDLPDEPVWMLAPAVALQSDGLLPEGTRAFGSALRGAQRVTLTLGAHGDRLSVSLDVACRNVDQASTLVIQLEQLTETLRTWIAREHVKPNPGDLSGVLTGGSFRREDRRVFGSWPIPKEFVRAMSEGAGK
jgi:hypothetical protein